jgi:hypothetical protein
VLVADCPGGLGDVELTFGWPQGAGRLSSDDDPLRVVSHAEAVEPAIGANIDGPKSDQNTRQNGGVAALLWDDVKCFFDPDLMGALPDVRVPGASVEDWQAVLDLVAERGWRCQYFEGETVLPVPRAEVVLSGSADTECPSLRVWPAADVLAIFRFHAANEVDFDVDLRELQGQERLDVFCGFLREIGRRLGKPVLMDPEGDSGHSMLGFDVEADRVVLVGEAMVT